MTIVGGRFAAEFGSQIARKRAPTGIENGNQDGCGQHQGRFYLVWFDRAQARSYGVGGRSRPSLAFAAPVHPCTMAACGRTESGWSDVARKAAVEPGMVLVQGVVKSADKAATTTKDGCFQGNWGGERPGWATWLPGKAWRLRYPAISIIRPDFWPRVIQRDCRGAATLVF